MRKYLIIFLLILFSCSNPTESNNEPAKKANIVLDGSLTRFYTTYNAPAYRGYVKNIGNAIGYNCMVEITCYDANKTIIDVASGFPANLADIGIGERAIFEAICFELTSFSQIGSTKIKITFLTR